MFYPKEKTIKSTHQKFISRKRVKEICFYENSLNKNVFMEITVHKITAK